jgi:predicted alpha/beta-fold hydrolase
MLKKIIGNFQTILTVINSNVKSSYRDIEYKNLGFKVYDENESKNIMIFIHGFGGNQDATYIKTFIDKLTSSNVNVLTFDAPGVGKSIKHKQFWGGGSGDQGLLDDVIEWVIKQNKWDNIFVVGYSAGGGFLLSYLCGGGKIINKYKDKITYSFFVSPTIKHNEMLRHAQKNNGFIYNSVVSVSHTIALVKHRFYHKKFLEIPHIIKNCTFNIIYANIYGSGNRKVLHKTNPPTQKINGLAIYTEDDPITPLHLMEEYRNYCDVKVLPFGGHVGFYNLDGSRENEKIILKKIKEIIEQDQER